MAKLNLTSSTTFLYFNDLEGAKRFFAETLDLPTALDQGWVRWTTPPGPSAGNLPAACW